jgi:hypothetical protein
MTNATAQLAEPEERPHDSGLLLKIRKLGGNNASARAMNYCD